MKPSLIPAEQASRFYLHWLNADREKRQPKIQALSQTPLNRLDFPALLKQETDSGYSLPRAMRRIRNLLVCTIIERDLSGKADLSEVVEAMTLFAEFAIRTHLASIYDELADIHGVPMGAQSGKKQEMIVLGMGKLGGRELNVSSDIDLIFVYPENGDTVSSRPGQRLLSNQEFFTRLGKRFIGALSEITEDGFTFRVDMALRPNGASGPLVASIGMVEQYLIVQGREWERYAWIKARAVTGNPEDIETLQRIVRPFIYRRYLDFSVIDAIRNLHQQIRADVVRQERLHPERSNNVKLGRGGIREIEFLAQMFQLIRGGRDQALQDRSTRNTLHILAEKRQLDEETVNALLDSYTFLRNLEHRIQYLDDAQVHSLPSNENDLLLIAQAMGMDDSRQLLGTLQKHREFVSAQFDAIFSDKSTPQDQSKPVIPQPLLSSQTEEEQIHTLQTKFEMLGFADTKAAAQRMLAFWKTNRILSLSDNNRTKLISLINSLLPELRASAHDPLVTLGRLLDFFESIARRTAYLSLLTEYPAAAHRLMKMLDASEWAARYLTRHPILLDELLDARTLLAPPDWHFFTSELDRQLENQRSDTERLMDTLREAHHAQLFRFLAQDLAGGLTVERLADHLSKLADIIVEATLREVWLAMPKRHRDTPRFAVIAYGKLGGKELGYASDLDLIFLYEDDHADAPMLYARLAQRFITWMTSPTSAGILFDIDIALRPDGASGLMVSSFESFERYQNESAWAWEHQALTRARFCAGDETIGKRFEALRNRILRQPRDPAWLREKILEMRQRIHDAHPNRSALFDLKHDAGGMIDIEFIVQYLVLEYSLQYPELTENFGNIALLKMSEGLGLIPKDSGEKVSAIYRNFRKLQHQIRMQGAEQAKVTPESVIEQSDEVKKLWKQVFG
ncbi:bifunctional [glutamate--ammonia ligase]-adenylyl-L-tyrosine phosphorylase/[glutamate--ammonia-ligase] adenylyltransferase [Oxalobacter paraformigenes]|uniref:Bifunctional glutamine synthetase adenylyltransferase/adenylyl-removing enzyme n=1 Tax=Oxalobacter paraformigenes TaxID=556268 RepID=C3X5K1_9BURK|nr:bifunctional [glutamate--ammonia ligase]-adenylyl-L-tyrosine phosphorylase/[glutamate--ammonia-ligase] adenylyltransferase [Oxalobacter paraformigenes]EEO28487.1 hypothetical protein OFAG_01640 [Oxalobacter paraformigenes]